MGKKKQHIAIVGMAFRFPGGISNSGQLWQALVDKQDLVTAIPADRWGTEAYFHPNKAEQGRSYTWAAGVLDHIDEFDADFFGISPREAQQMDPQQRLLLELTWEALEDGNQVPEKLRGSDCAVHIGIASNDYLQRRMDDLSSMDSYSMTGVTASIASNRISYAFDLHGPSMSIDTACSSSLVALHQACQSIVNGEASMAITGGVNMLLSPFPYVGFSKASMLSPTGTCKSFDAAADGYVRSEGAAILFLKTLEQAEADGDPIHAVIRATGVNSDGQTNGITVPNPDYQADLLESVYKRAGIKVSDVTYFEAHGTGTPVGDPIETSAIGRVLGMAREEPLLIGSVKSNMGHLETASGMAGLIKVIHCLKHRAVPATINYKNPNPNIDFKALNLQVVSEYTPLPDSTKPLVMGVNSFGFGGANGHVLVEEYRPKKGRAEAQPHTDPGHCPPLFISANDEVALHGLAANLEQLLAADSVPDYYDVAYTAVYHRQLLKHRAAVVGSSPAEIRQTLGRLSRGNAPEEVIQVSDVPETTRLAMVFSGNGSQYVGMGLTLYAHDPVFRDAIDHIDGLFRSHSKFSLLDELKKDAESSQLQQTEVAQPLLFAVQMGLVAVLQHKGIVAEAVIGHSVGEVAAACVAGALTLEQAVQVIYERSQAQGMTRGTGRMAAVGLSQPDVQALLQRLELSEMVEIAGLNSPNNVTLSGPLSALQRIEKLAQKEGIFYRLLDLDYAFHSRYMDSIEQQVEDHLQSLQPTGTSVPYFSTVTGEELAGEQLDATYWWHNIRKPVLFGQAVDRMLEQGFNLLLEVGPHPVLKSYLNDTVRTQRVRAIVLPTLSRDGEEQLSLTRAAYSCYLGGYPIRLDHDFPFAGEQVRLPAYPWNRQRHWYPLTSEGYDLVNRHVDHPLLGSRIAPAEPRWENHLDTLRMPYLADHVVGKAVVFPAAAYAEMALAASASWYGHNSHDIEDLEIRAPLVLEDGHAKTIHFTLQPDSGDFVIQSRTRLSDDPWVTHVVGRIAGQVQVQTLQDINLADAIDRAEPSITSAQHYQQLSELGLEYGPAFQALNEIWVHDHEALARLKLPAVLAQQSLGYLFHPSLMDAGFQSLATLLLQQDKQAMASAYIPVRLGRLQLYGGNKQAAFFGLTLRNVSRRAILADFRFYDKHGHAVASIEGCRFRSMPSARSHALPSLYEFQPVLKPRRHEFTSSRLPEVKDLIIGASDMYSAEEVTQRKIHHLEVMPLIDAMMTAFAYEAVSATGVGYDSFTLDSLMSSANIHESHRFLLARVLRMLQAEGIAESEDGVSWTVYKPAELPGARDIWQTLVNDYPAYLSELTLAGRFGRHLLEFMQMSTEEDAAIATCGESTFNHLFEDSPYFNGLNQSVKSVLKQVADSIPGNRRLRVLEFGLGQSNFARYLKAELAIEACDYVIACNDEQAEQNLQAEFSASQLPVEIEMLALPLTKDTLPASMHSGFDVVILNHVLHQADDLSQSLHDVRKLLLKDGMLVLVERRPDRLNDLTFGTDPNWWKHSHGEEPVSRLMEADDWRAVIQQCNYVDINIGYEMQVNTDSGPYMLLAKNPVNTTIEHAEQKHQQVGWILMAGDSELSMDYAQRLRGQLDANEANVILVESGDEYEQRSPAHFVIHPTDKSHFNRLLQALDEEGIAFDQVVNLMGLSDSNPLDEATLSLQELRCAGTLHLVQALHEAPGESMPGLTLISSGAVPLPSGHEDWPVHPSQSPLWGLGRVLANEYPDLHCRMIDLQPQSSPSALIDSLLQELQSDEPDDEVLLSADTRHVLRMLPAKLATKNQPAESEDRLVSLDFETPGPLKHLQWMSRASKPVADDEVRIATRAVGLNFRDVMFAMGLLSDEAVESGFSGPTLGMELSGVITEAGAAVTDYEVGDPVIGFAPSCFSTEVVTKASAIFHKPDDWTFEAAATIPTTFFTAFYALHYLADVQPGEKVLIHGAAGGVGIAAIQLAYHLGAEIFATAGSDEKRDFAYLLGAHHVLDSRSLKYADKIMQITNGEGVDVVLNSLAGEAINKNFAILKPFGRFLELGKRDFYENSKIGLRPFRNNISYFGIDADQLMSEKPGLTQNLFRQMMQLFNEGILNPMPYRVFQADHVQEAFRYMQQSRQIGKIVVSFEGQNLLPKEQQLSLGPLVLNSESCYLVTGGLSGFGFRTAEWLIEKGASHLVLLSRSGVAAPDIEARIEALRAEGIEIHIRKADVTDQDQLKAVIDETGSILPPLAGICHAATVFDDSMVSNMSNDQLLGVLAPKIQGAYHLHRLTEQMPLDFFILYSSVTTYLGNPGQANYVAANLYLEALAQYRRNAGLPATCVAWGAIDDVGFLARNNEIKEALESRMGSHALKSQDALDMLERMIMTDSNGFAVADFNWKNTVKYMPAAKLPKYEELLRLQSDTAEFDQLEDFSELIEGLSNEEVKTLVSEILVSEIAQILRLSVSNLPLDRSIYDLGMDSLMGMELVMAVEERFSVNIPAMSLAEGPTIARLADRITHLILSDESDEAGAAADQHTDTVTSVTAKHAESLSDGEIDRLSKEIAAEHDRNISLIK